MGKCLEHAHRTLAVYERLIMKEQDIEHEELADATRHLVQLRDSLIAERRGEVGCGVQQHDTLDRVNSMLSVASSAEFPLVGIRWKRLCTLRDALRELIGDLENGELKGLLGREGAQRQRAASQ